MFFRAVLVGVALAVALPADADASPWALQTDPDIGFRYSYPVEAFSPLEGDGKPYFHYSRLPRLTPSFW